MSVQASGTGTLAHAGVVLPRLLADRVGLTAALDAAMARAGFVPIRPRGRLLVDAACALAAGAECIADVEAWTGQVELYGPGGGASGSTVLRALNEYSETLTGDGLPGRRLARASARVRERVWRLVVDRHGRLPAVEVAGAPLTRTSTREGAPDTPVVVVRLDSTVISRPRTRTEPRPTTRGTGSSR